MFNVHVQQKLVYAVQIEWPNIIHGFWLYAYMPAKACYC